MARLLFLIPLTLLQLKFLMKENNFNNLLMTKYMVSDNKWKFGFIMWNRHEIANDLLLVSSLK